MDSENFNNLIQEGYCYENIFINYCEKICLDMHLRAKKARHFYDGIILDTNTNIEYRVEIKSKSEAKLHSFSITADNIYTYKDIAKANNCEHKFIIAVLNKTNGIAYAQTLYKMLKPVELYGWRYPKLSKIILFNKITPIYYFNFEQMVQIFKFDENGNILSIYKNILEITQ